jgi:hypothetical protein
MILCFYLWKFSISCSCWQWFYPLKLLQVRLVGQFPFCVFIIFQLILLFHPPLRHLWTWEGCCFLKNHARIGTTRGYHWFLGINPYSKVLVHRFSLLFPQYFCHSFFAFKFQLNSSLIALHSYCFRFHLPLRSDCAKASVFCLGRAQCGFCFWIYYLDGDVVYPFECDLQLFHIFYVFNLGKFMMNCSCMILKLFLCEV